MEAFGAIEEEYIESKKVNRLNDDYKALHCEPGWFFSSEENTEPTNQFINTKFKGDFLFWKNSYLEAITAYQEYVSVCPNLSLTLKRDCLEGISRSYLSLNCFCYAIKYAKDLEELSSNFQTHTSGFSLLYDCFKKVGRYKNSIIWGQKLVLLHSSNFDMWIKLGSAYYGHYQSNANIPLVATYKENICENLEICCSAQNYELDCFCTDEQNFSEESVIDYEKQITTLIICLLYAEFHLESVANSCSGFSLQQNLKLQKKTKKDIELFCVTPFNKHEDILHYRDCIKKRFTGVKSVKDSEEETFMDRENSKFTSNEQVNCVIETDELDFEKYWFQFK